MLWFFEILRFSLRCLRFLILEISNISNISKISQFKSPRLRIHVAHGNLQVPLNLVSKSLFLLKEKQKNQRKDLYMETAVKGTCNFVVIVLSLNLFYLVQQYQLHLKLSIMFLIHIKATHKICIFFQVLFDIVLMH